MTQPLNPPTFIQPPPPPPAAYGLLTATGGAQKLPPHGYGGGTQWIPEVCGDAHLYPADCGDETPPEKELEDGVLAGGDLYALGRPFIGYVSINCGSLGLGFDELERRARVRMNVKEQPIVERAFWGDGTGTDFDYLHDAAVTPDIVNLGLAASVPAGIALAEEFIATCYEGMPGLLHARPRLAAHFGGSGQLRWDSPLVKTWRGNTVVFGDGYSGIGPAADAPSPTTEWMYVTGRVLVWRSEDVFVPDPRQTFNRSLNQQHVLAERNYAISVECCIGAVEITIPTTGA